jgi:hypothetical protein
MATATQTTSGPPPNSPIAQGQAGPNDGFPQWGIDQTAPPAAGQAGGGTWKITEAKTAADKARLLTQGYLLWFTSQKAAQDFINSQYGAFNGSIPGGQVFAGLSDFFGRLTEANTWLRAGEIAIGIVLIGIGVAKLTGTTNLVAKAVKARIP